ncbi:GNAT family N-acetyltransferase [Pseudomonas baltica]|jgi:N-acetylglutamate synthase-like GNAT family acetyltransferase|uniref:GNAT family N-acetyltransferase n=1 Tax=Pseudomonas baltica TaxID=2762576 RepID=UPI00289691D9|nr:GNAT family N-acetyltransferase [Pseudomonas baltica]
MQCQIRLATDEDAVAINRVIIAALRESNSKDYPADVIAAVERGFTVQAIRSLMTQRQVYVGTVGLSVIATASLDDDVVRSVFVEPKHQRIGIGRQLMAVIQSSAASAGVDVLRVPSSITAQDFYASLGFVAIRDEFHGAERTVIMQLQLGK